MAETSWARLDDRYDDNRKVRRAWRRCRAAVGLHTMAITYCARHETDGLVDCDWLADRLPAERERKRALEVLVDVGLFIQVDDEHWRIHDYLDFNESRADAEARRLREAERKRKARGDGSPPRVRPDAAGTAAGQRADANGASAGTPNDPSRAQAPARPRSRPDPSLSTPPRPPKGGTRRRERERFEEEFAAWCAEAFPGEEVREMRAVLSEMCARWPEHQPTVDSIRSYVEQKRSRMGFLDPGREAA